MLVPRDRERLDFGVPAAEPSGVTDARSVSGRIGRAVRSVHPDVSSPFLQGTQHRPGAVFEAAASVHVWPR